MENLGRLEKLNERNFLKFISEKCQILRWGRNNKCSSPGWVPTSWKVCFPLKYLGFIVGSKFGLTGVATSSCQAKVPCDKVVSSIMVCIRKITTCLREVILPVCSALQCLVHFQTAQHKQDIGILEGVQQMATKTNRGLRHLFHERQSWTVQPEAEKA